MQLISTIIVIIILIIRFYCIISYLFRYTIILIILTISIYSSIYGDLSLRCLVYLLLNYSFNFIKLLLVMCSAWLLLLFLLLHHCRYSNCNLWFFLLRLTFILLLFITIAYWWCTLITDLHKFLNLIIQEQLLQFLEKLDVSFIIEGGVILNGLIIQHDQVLCCLTLRCLSQALLILGYSCQEVINV